MSCIKLLNKIPNKSLLQSSLIRSSVTAVRNESQKSPAWVPVDPVTHTGQHWEKDDYRLARFVDRPKQINKNFAINLIEEIPPKPCKERVVWCDGGDEHVGHPRVYINLDQPGNHSCGYCGLRFYHEEHH